MSIGERAAVAVYACVVPRLLAYRHMPPEVSRRVDPSAVSSVLVRFLFPGCVRADRVALIYDNIVPR